MQCKAFSTTTFFFPLGNPQYQWDTIVHCGDTVSFDFIANDYDVYPNGSLQNFAIYSFWRSVSRL